MAVEGAKSGTSPAGSLSGEEGSNGRAADLLRFLERRVDRLDSDMRLWLAGLLGFDGLLLLAIALVATGEWNSRTNQVSNTLILLVPWLGMSVSIVAFWKICRVVYCRHELVRSWLVTGGNVSPHALGELSPEGGSITLAPEPIVALVSTLFWMVPPGAAISAIYFPHVLPGGNDVAGRITIASMILFAGTLLAVGGGVLSWWSMQPPQRGD